MNAISYFLLAGIFLSANLTECKFNLMTMLDKFESSEHKHDNILAPKFSWNNCGPSTDSFIVNSLTIQPDPLTLPGTLSFSGNVDVRTNLTEPITVGKNSNLFFKLKNILFNQNFKKKSCT
jgi:hypothetical protein